VAQSQRDNDRRDPERGRRLRASHYRVSFGLALLMLVLDAITTYAELSGDVVDALRLGALASLALVSALGAEMEKSPANRGRSPKGLLLVVVGLLQVLVCLRTGGLASPYFLLVASTCAFAGLTLRPARAMLLSATLVGTYALGIRFLAEPVPGLGLGGTVSAIIIHSTFALVSAGISTRFAVTHRETVATLEVQSMLDPLTSLQNRRAFLQKLDGELQRAERFSWPITMLIIDLDWFKKLNDRYGHPVGDQVLVETAALLRENAGALEHVARVGGEEFAVAAVAAEPFHGRDLADRLVRAFRARNWEHIRPGMKVTASIGVAVLPPGRHAGETTSIVTRLMADADQALYHVKQSGRDGFHVSVESPASSSS